MASRSATPRSSERIGTHVLGERDPAQDSRCVQFAQAGGENGRGCAELALEISEALGAV